MHDSADLRITVGDLDLIRSWFSTEMTAGLVRGIDLYQEQAGDVVSILGDNGLPILGFGRDRFGFYLIDAAGERVDSSPLLENLLPTAGKRIMLPRVRGSRRAHRWFMLKP
jgi:hypothetical protein